MGLLAITFWTTKWNNWHFAFLQASQMIVAYDEHEVNNTFKFGVIYQKFRQVSCPRAAFVVPVHQRSTSTDPTLT